MIETQSGVDIHGEYVQYLLLRKKVLHPDINTVHAIIVDTEKKHVIIKRRRSANVPLRLRNHILWYCKKNYGIISHSLI